MSASIGPARQGESFCWALAAIELSLVAHAARLHPVQKREASDGRKRGRSHIALEIRDSGPLRLTRRLNLDGCDMGLA